MVETIYNRDFCRERCILYKQTIERLEGYNIPELIIQQKQKIHSYCSENCNHSQEEFSEWLKKRQASA